MRIFKELHLTFTKNNILRKRVKDIGKRNGYRFGTQWRERERERGEKKVKIKCNVWTIGSLTNRCIQKGSVDSYCDGSLTLILIYLFLNSVPYKACEWLWKLQSAFLMTFCGKMKVNRVTIIGWLRHQIHGMGLIHRNPKPFFPNRPWDSQ